MPSPRYSKEKGREWESDIVDYLIANGVPHAERRRLNGVNDRGDVAGIPSVVIEAKHERSYALPSWLREATRERDNDHADIGVVWARQNRVPGAENGFIIMDPATFLRMLRGLGYIAGDNTGGMIP